MRILVPTSIVLATATATAAPTTLTVTSESIAQNAPLPVQLTCDGASKAPTISWSAAPANAKSIAILVDDTDADGGPFTHMLVTNLPPGQTSLDLGGAAPEQATVERNDLGRIGYAAPCPEDGRHHYHYRVFALDARTAPARAEGKVTRDSFLRAIHGHVLAEGELTAVYVAEK
jgi:Raf kinase inhibitor-like YbhB/YbcL family protein